MAARSTRCACTAFDTRPAERVDTLPSAVLIDPSTRVHPRQDSARRNKTGGSSTSGFDVEDIGKLGDDAPFSQREDIS